MRIGVAGAGTMGAGIAQLACMAGYATVLHDPDPAALERGAVRLREGLRKGAERGRWSADEAQEAARRLESSVEIEGLTACGLVIEAAPERLDLKRDLFARLEAACERDAVLATNTSSLPVGEIAAEAELPGRICGMHFFNPPPLMKLVEIVAAPASGARAIEVATAVAERMERTAIHCTDSPGFVVNRCNRPFALESLQILGEEIATPAEIDTVIREDGGYRMGPFELMDLIGIDVNLEVARSFYDQRPEPRWEPHPIQGQMVAAGHLGRKTGRGFYVYTDGQGGDRPPQARAAGPPAFRPSMGSAEPAPADHRPPPSVSKEILERVVAQLVNEASFAVEEGVASPGDIDTAMRLGLNHPRGPFEWLEELGAERVASVLDELRERTGSDRYRVAPSLSVGS